MKLKKLDTKRGFKFDTQLESKEIDIKRGFSFDKELQAISDLPAEKRGFKFDHELSLESFDTKRGFDFDAPVKAISDLDNLVLGDDWKKTKEIMRSRGEGPNKAFIEEFKRKHDVFLTANKELRAEKGFVDKKPAPPPVEQSGGFIEEVVDYEPAAQEVEQSSESYNPADHYNIGGDPNAPFQKVDLNFTHMIDLFDKFKINVFAKRKLKFNIAQLEREGSFMDLRLKYKGLDFKL